MYEYERYHHRPDPRDKPPRFFTDPIEAEKSTVQTKVLESTQEVRLISSKVYPNREFGVGFLPREKKLTADKRYDRGEYENLKLSVELENHYELIGDSTDVLYTKREVKVLRPKLGIGAEPSQHQKKYGLKGITAHGRKMLRNAGTVIDIICKGRRGALPQMGTLTIPSLDEDKMRAIAINWAYIQKRFYEKCKRRYKRLGYRFYYASCTEIQPGRWAERGEVGLHLHFLFISYRLGTKSWCLPDDWVRDEWKHTLEGIVGKGVISGNINYRRETVRASSAAYLAKYTSKGTEFIREISEKYGKDILPSQWWSIDNSLRKCIQAHTVQSRGIIAKTVLEWAKTNDPRYIEYARRAEIDHSYCDCRTNELVEYKLTLGYGGRLTPEGYRVLFGMGTTGSIREYLPHTLDT
jgi:hypothetical protein